MRRDGRAEEEEVVVGDKVEVVVEVADEEGAAAGCAGLVGVLVLSSGWAPAPVPLPAESAQGSSIVDCGRGGWVVVWLSGQVGA